MPSGKGDHLFPCNVDDVWHILSGAETFARRQLKKARCGGARTSRVDVDLEARTTEEAWVIAKAFARVHGWQETSFKASQVCTPLSWPVLMIRVVKVLTWRLICCAWRSMRQSIPVGACFPSLRVRRAPSFTHKHRKSRKRFCSFSCLDV